MADEQRRHGCHRRPWVVGAIIHALLFLVSIANGDDALLDEYRVKAAFLYNAMKFVQWPAAAEVDGAGPRRFCVVGTDPFGDPLDRAIANRQVQGRQLVVQRFGPGAGTDEVAQCSLLFLSRSERERTATLLAALGDAPVLTVAEWEGFTLAGGILEVLIVDGKLAFVVNHGAADARGLRISSQLLKLAKHVHR